MASFPSDPASYPYYRVIFYRTEKGKSRKEKAFYFRRDEFKKTEVRDWKKRKEIAYKDGNWQPWDKPGQISRARTHTIREAIDQYIPIARRTLAESTADVRINYLHQFACFTGETRLLKNIPDGLIESWINEPRLSYNTRRKRRTVINGLYRHIKNRMKAIEQMPEVEILSTKAERQAAKSKKFKTWLRDDELERLITELHSLHREICSNAQAHSANAQKYARLRPDLEYLFRLVHKTGMRLGDIHNFDLRWIQPSPNLQGKRIIHFGATGIAPKSQSMNEAIPVMPEIVNIIDRLIAQGTRQPFKMMSKQWISKTFKKCIRRAYPEKAQRMSFRNLRDSAANYWLYERNLPVKIVQQILRHNQIETTMIYVHDDLSEVEKQVWNES